MLRTPVTKVAKGITLRDTKDLCTSIDEFRSRNNISLLSDIVNLFPLSSINQERVDKVLNLLKIRNFVAHFDKENCKEFLKSDARPQEVKKTVGGGIRFDRELSKTVYHAVFTLLEDMDAELVQKGLLESAQKTTS